MSHFVNQRFDQMADCHRQRLFESSHCSSKLLPSDLLMLPSPSECVRVCNASFPESITFSHENMTPWLCAPLYCMCQSHGATDRVVTTRESKGDWDRDMDGRMNSVRSIRGVCSRHNGGGRRQEEMPVTNTTDLNRCQWISGLRISPDRRLWAFSTVWSGFH